MRIGLQVKVLDVFGIRLDKKIGSMRIVVWFSLGKYIVGDYL